MIKYVAIGGIILSFSVPVLSTVVSIIIPRYSSYLKVNYWEAGVGKGTMLLWLLEIIMCVCIYLKRIRENDKDTFMIVAGTIIYLTFEFMGLNLVMFSRLALVFRFFIIFLLPMFARYIAPKSRIIYRCIVMLVVTVAFMSYASSDARIYSFFWQ